MVKPLPFLWTKAAILVEKELPEVLSYEKQHQAKEEYERSHQVLLLGQEQNLSFALKAISEDHQRHFVETLIDEAKDYRSVASLYRLDTGWQLGQQGLRQLLESLKKAEQEEKQ